MPRVSVIIPTYDRTRYVCEAIESVWAQTYRDFEIIVIDNGGTEEMKRALKPYIDSGKIQYVFEPRKGIPFARNSGMAKASGEYVAFLDDDDLWLPGKLAIQVDLLEKNPGAGFVCAEVYAIDEKGKVYEYWPKKKGVHDTFDDIYAGNYLHVPTVVVRASCFKEVGVFDENMTTTEDYDMWLRLAKKYKFIYLAQPLAQYRIHRNCTSKLQKHFDTQLKNNLKVVNKKEIIKGVSLLRRWKRAACVYYQYAGRHFEAGNFLRAALNYGKAILIFPFVGYVFKGYERQLPVAKALLNAVKAYIMPLVCLVKAFDVRIVSLASRGRK